jgi:hypothetical protein
MRDGGYGQLTINYRKVLAHRLSWELHCGQIPDGLHVLHKCDVACCINPDHLFLGKPQDNVIDKTEKDRQAKGEGHGMHKLTRGEVIEIRGGLGDQRKTAKLYGVSQSTVGCIRRGVTWKHLARG